MNVRLVAITFSLIFLIAGCSDNYHVMMRNWVGIEEVDLIRGWGEPQRVYTKEESTFFVYHEDGGPPSGCATTFELIKGIVDSFDYEGEGCVGDFYTHTK